MNITRGQERQRLNGPLTQKRPSIMTQLPTHAVEDALKAFHDKCSLVFGTDSATLVTDGIYARIDTPAADAHEATSAIQQRIAQVFQEARTAGIENPIVVGSIPFDATKPSCLIVPERYEFVSPAASAKPTKAAPPAWASEHEDGRLPFHEAVRELLQMLDVGPVQKVVLSRMSDIRLSKAVDTRLVLSQILQSSPGSYRFFVPLNEDETLIGASPELLLRKQGKQIVSNPLAGTIPHAQINDGDLAARHLLGSVKERLEHRLVVEQIHSVLKSYCTSLEVPEEPSLLKTSSLWHLSTLIKGMLSASEINALGLASALHPTPAVCGFPSALAREAIRKVETFDRGFYTGLTGWMNADGDGEWAVTIRCAIFKADSARLFAGAGIVPGSTPEQEWSETAAKMAPMLRVLDMTQ